SISLPSLLVISRIMGPKKTIVYAGLVTVFSAVAGFVYGMFFL
ncbi:MAG: permease, partial [Methanomicrobium sp.]|nr:permease [Methanomicrobium sp.]